MKSNNINWVGNKVVEQGPTHPSSRPQPPEWSFSNAPPVTQPITPSVTQQITPMVTQPSPFAEKTEPSDMGRTMFRQGPPPSTDIEYIPGYLASHIGKNVRAEFIVGSYQYTDKTGKLVAVGANYFVLEDVNSHTLIMCDLYSVKFVTILM